MHMISMPGKKEMQSLAYPYNYPMGQLNLPENKVKHHTCMGRAGLIDMTCHKRKSETGGSHEMNVPVDWVWASRPLHLC